jgi:hypothetical protein
MPTQGWWRRLGDEYDPLARGERCVPGDLDLAEGGGDGFDGVAADGDLVGECGKFVDDVAGADRSLAAADDLEFAERSQAEGSVISSPDGARTQGFSCRGEPALYWSR